MIGILTFFVPQKMAEMKTTDQAINKLFWVMKNKYGSGWVIDHPQPGIVEDKANWLLKLKYYPAEDIGKALDCVKDLYTGKPPDLDEFVKLIKHVKGQRIGHLSNHYYVPEKIDVAPPGTGREQLRIMRENGAIF